MAMSSGGSGDGPMADINVTPLVDVMLVLLIIFMITTPLMNHRTKVELPRADGSDEVAEMVQASPGWDWVVATPQATPLLLSAFGLEPGPPEKHGALYVLGDLRRGMFWRLPGDALPHELIAMARRYGAAHPP